MIKDHIAAKLPNGHFSVLSGNNCLFDTVVCTCYTESSALEIVTALNLAEHKKAEKKEKI